MNDVEKLRKALEGLKKNRDELDHLVDASMYINVQNLKIALDKVNLFAPIWDGVNYDIPSNIEELSKCLISQEELKNITKEIRETIGTIEDAIYNLKCNIENLEDIFQRVDMSCMD